MVQENGFPRFYNSFYVVDEAFAVNVNEIVRIRNAPSSDVLSAALTLSRSASLQTSD